MDGSSFPARSNTLRQHVSRRKRSEAADKSASALVTPRSLRTTSQGGLAFVSLGCRPISAERSSANSAWVPLASTAAAPMPSNAGRLINTLLQSVGLVA